MKPDPATQKAQRDALKLQFYSEFDRSLAERWLGFTDKELGMKGQLLGTGTHFAAYRFGGMVYKRALPSTFARGALTLRGWLAALGRAKAVGGLMPPYEVLAQGEAPSLVMPYGDGPLGSAGPAWQPIAGTVQAFEAELAKAGLILDDVLQIRCRNGVPFVVDLSDLRLMGSG